MNITIFYCVFLFLLVYTIFFVENNFRARKIIMGSVFVLLIVAPWKFSFANFYITGYGVISLLYFLWRLKRATNLQLFLTCFSILVLTLCITSSYLFVIVQPSFFYLTDPALLGIYLFIILRSIMSTEIDFFIAAGLALLIAENLLHYINSTTFGSEFINPNYSLINTFAVVVYINFVYLRYNERYVK